MCTMPPLTMQVPAVWLEKLTARFDDAVAFTAKSGSPNVTLPSAPNAIVWLALPTDCAGVSVPLLPANAPVAVYTAVTACGEPATVRLEIEPLVATPLLPLTPSVTGDP